MISDKAFEVSLVKMIAWLQANGKRLHCKGTARNSKVGVSLAMRDKPRK